MPYDPKAITTDDRTYSYKLLWLGLPFSLALLAGMYFEVAGILIALSGGFVSGSLLAMVWAWAHDEFAREELAFASRWALSFAGIVLFLQVVPISREYDLNTGLVLATMAVIFHAALYFRRIKDGVLAGDEA